MWIKTWTQGHWGKRTFWCGRWFPFQGWRLQKIAVFQCWVLVRSRAYYWLWGSSSKVPGYRSRRGSLRYMHTYPSCFGRAGRSLHCSYRSSLSRQFTCLRFLSSSPWSASYQPVPSTSRASAFRRCRTVSWSRKNSYCCLPCWLLASQSFPTPNKPLQWTRLSPSRRSGPHTSALWDSQSRTHSCYL